MLANLAIFLAGAVVFVPLFKRAGLGAVLGYLAAGVVIGPWGAGLITDVDSILHFSEFGVVLLLFVIGLELQPARLWALRGSVFGLGGAQVGLSCAVLAAIGWQLGLSGAAALVVGFGLAMSSTALVLQMLGERNELATRHGRSAFSILLFQDLAIIPFLALVPALAGHGQSELPFWIGGVKAVCAVVVVVIGGRLILRPLLRIAVTAQVAEIFTAASLLVVASAAFALDAVGLSMSLGAFLAGVLLADSEYRHEIQANIEPFKGLLLGLFFMAVGMSANLGLFLSSPGLVIGLALGLILVKAGVLYGLGRLARLNRRASLSLAGAMAQGGEFAFVLFAVASGVRILPQDLEQLLVVVVTLSMIVTPPLYAVLARTGKDEETLPFDEIDVQPTPVIIAGFGPSGQIIARILRVKKIPFTVLEKNWQHVDFVRKFGNPVFYSDATRVEVLRAAHADKARLIVIAIPDQETSMRIVESVRRHFPRLKIFAMARDRRHALLLRELGVKAIRRTYLSSLEMSREVLMELGVDKQATQEVIDAFRSHDEKSLQKQQAVFHDEQQMIQSARDAARELEDLFETDPTRSAVIHTEGTQAS